MKPMTEQYAERCVKRLSGLRHAPDDALALKEVINAFWRCSDDQEHAAAATDNLAASQWFPTPADVMQACDDTRKQIPDDSWKPNLDPCPECHGSGWRIVERGGYSGAKRCPCGDGRAKVTHG